MAHINLPEGLPGIRGPMAFRPDAAKHLNDCFFCQNAHGGLAQHYLQCDMKFIDGIKANMSGAEISTKLKALLSIAESVQKGGKQVTPIQIETAKLLGATEMEIHDTVLIAAAFCMFNRYVDGLGTWAPHDREFYINRAKSRAEEG